MRSWAIGIVIIILSWVGGYCILFDINLFGDDSSEHMSHFDRGNNSGRDEHLGKDLTATIQKSDKLSPTKSQPIKKIHSDTVAQAPTKMAVTKARTSTRHSTKSDIRITSTKYSNKKKLIRKGNVPNLSVEELLGQVHNLSSNPKFSKIDPRLTPKKTKLYMRKEAYYAFIKMYKAAAKDGIKLQIVSALRTFYHQKYIWDNKWLGKRLVEGRNLAITEKNPVGRAMIILKYSSMPGTSRHHWGTDIDLNSLEDSYFQQGEGKRVYDWLQKNAIRFGFAQTYTKKDSRRPHGYREEKWHWSYLPLSRIFLEQYSQKITYKNLTGFEGSEVAKRLRVIKNYVMSINPDCK